MNKIVRAPLLNNNDEYLNINEWLVEKGTYVNKGDSIATLEGSKSTMELTADSNGYFIPLVDEGTDAEITRPIALILKSMDENIEEILSNNVEETISTEVTKKPEMRFTKKAEILAKKNNITIEELTPTGDGVIREKDILNFLEINKRNDDFKDLVYDVYKKNSPKKLLIIGGGKGAATILDVVNRSNNYIPVGILDDNVKLIGKKIMGCPILGEIKNIESIWENKLFDVAIISISNNIKFRDMLFEKYRNMGIEFCNIIDPSVSLHSNFSKGQGNIIMANSRIGACTSIGDNNFLSSYVNIEHHNTIGNCCTFGPGVSTSGSVSIGSRVIFGTGIYIEPNLSIGNDSTISSGAIITKNIKENVVVKVKSNLTETISHR